VADRTPTKEGAAPAVGRQGRGFDYELYHRLGNCRFDRGRSLAAPALDCSAGSPGAEST